MKYIKGESGITFDPYIAYLNTIRDRLPQHIWDFASNPRHYNLDAPESLHDAWLEGLSIAESMTNIGNEPGKTAITIRLLGPMHDRYHVLYYSGVRKYEILGPMGRGKGADLYTHEIRLTDDGRAIIHEIHFAEGEGVCNRITIEMEDLRHEMEIR